MDTEKLELSAHRAVEYLQSQLKPDGSYGPEAADLAAYYKSPALYLRAGRVEQANRVLDFIQQNYSLPNGDFGSRGVNTDDPALSQYGAYINGWIAQGAQRAGRFDVAYPATSYLEGFYSKGKFSTLRPGDEQSDILTIAHLGLLALYTGQKKLAWSAGIALGTFLSQQSEPGKFYLRRTSDGLVTDFPDEAAFLFLVKNDEPQQAFFMLGYPIAFLSLLYRATAEESFLQVARDYFDFTATCRGVDAFHFSHKVAWGCSVLANLTDDERASKLSEAIVSHLLSVQSPQGGWHTDQPRVFQLDQTAEVALWLLEIRSEL
jgi:hypothetical protein